ncbi:MAG: hypothetical protein QXD13_00880, partial [Candidatus Pacearchaeota archaeon]
MEQQNNQQSQQPQSNKPVMQNSEAEEKKLEKKEDSNIIFIGNKPIINYIRSISVQLSKQDPKEVIIRSRGKFISKAVDIAEIARRKFLEKEGIKIKDIKISSEDFVKEGKQLH